MNAVNEVPTLNIDKICRVCLEESKDMRSVFSKLYQSELLEADVLYLSHVLIKITSVPVKINDGLPSSICSNCVNLINGAYKFKVQFDYSNHILERYKEDRDDKPEGQQETTKPITRSRKRKLEENTDSEDSVCNKSDDDSDDMNFITDDSGTDSDVSYSFRSKSAQISEVKPLRASLRITKNRIVSSDSESENENNIVTRSRASHKNELNGKQVSANKQLTRDTFYFESDFESEGDTPAVSADSECDKNSMNESGDIAKVQLTQADLKTKSKTDMKENDVPSSADSKQMWERRRRNGKYIFVCILCHYKTNCSGRIKEHMYVHTKEKPYKCDKCGMRTSYIRVIKHHMLNMHGIVR